MHIRLLALVAGAAIAGACAHGTQLAPAADATTMAGGMAGATASDAGVTLEAETDAWYGIPATLDRELTPLLVTITNGGRQQLRVRYSDFRLTDDGRAFAALPPFRIDEDVIQPVDPLLYPYSDFAVAPYLSSYYPGLTPYDAFGPFDRAYFDTYYPVFQKVNLPTVSMLRAALPEGVLSPGGSVKGFLYFEPIPGRVDRVTLEEVLQTPTGRDLGRIRIPFRVR